MKTFKKSDNTQGWPFADGEVVEVMNWKGCLLAEIDGKEYAMNGLATMLLKLPEVRIIAGKSVGPYIREALK